MPRELTLPLLRTMVIGLILFTSTPSIGGLLPLLGGVHNHCVFRLVCSIQEATKLCMIGINQRYAFTAALAAHLTHPHLPPVTPSNSVT